MHALFQLFLYQADKKEEEKKEEISGFAAPS